MRIQRCSVVLLVLVGACGSVNAGDGDGDGDGDADAAPDATALDAPSVEPNIVFVTSSTHDGTFGGDAVADSICTQRASEASLAGTYVAWLSGPSTNARDKLSGASGWVRVDGEPFANSVDDMLAGRIFYPVALDEDGISSNNQLWTATAGDGSYDVANGNCGGWANNATGPGPTFGQPMGGLGRFTSSGTGSCVSGRALLCFGIDRQATVEAPSETGRIAFVTEANLSGTAGVAAFDSQCTNEAVAAGLLGTFTAGVSTQQLGGVGVPVTDRITLNGETWVRPDGVKLFDNPMDMLGSNSQKAPIQMTASGLVRNAEVWTGAADWSGVNPNCGSWAEPTATGIVGVSALGGINGASFNGSGCTQLRPIYCFED